MFAVRKFARTLNDSNATNYGRASKMKAVRYGILGCGMMGKEHIRNIQLIDGATVSAVADPDVSIQTENKKLAPNALWFTYLTT